MRNIINLVIALGFVLAYLNHTIYQDFVNGYVRVAQFVLILYVIYIILFDFLRTLRKRLQEKFGMRMRIWKRKLKKLKPF